MAIKKATAGPWRTATVEVAVTTGEGDGLNSLRALRDRYNERSSYVHALGAAADNFYARAASAVSNLLSDEAVDQCEVILSDAATS